MVKKSVVKKIAITVGVLGAVLALGYYLLLEFTDETQAPAPAQPATASTVTTDAYSRVLATYVNDTGMVDYAGLKATPSDLDTYLSSIAVLNSSVYGQWDAQEQIAFWINVYNALTLEAIVDRYPIQAGLLRSLAYPRNSIRQIPGVWTDLEWTVMGRAYTLDAIEHEVLRGKFDEPRIHAALVCAAMGCPPLRNEPYSGAKLDAQLDDQMRRFLSNPKKFRIDRKENVVYLSPIFDWFGSDYLGKYRTEEIPNHGEIEGAVLSAVSRYVSSDDRAYLIHNTYSTQYLDYDWSLNEQ